jgi:hypothetical protein
MPLSKKCSKCGIEKLLETFALDKRRKDGRGSWCRACKYLDYRAWVKRNKYQANHYGRRYYYKHWENIKLKSRIARTGKKQTTIKDPTKKKARQKFAYAVKAGRIVRQPCGVCGKEPAEGHHEDYNKPFDVIWLCKDHHAELSRTYSECELLLRIVSGIQLT